MNDSLLFAVRDLYFSNIGYLKICIDNCSDELWETKVGGDFYWERIYNALITPILLLPVENKLFDLPMQNKGEPDERLTDSKHGKTLMHQVADRAKEHMEAYLEQERAKDLYEQVDFMGKSMSKLMVILSLMQHLAYHQGACDAALKDYQG